MKPGEKVHIGDGTYLEFTGYSFHLWSDNEKNIVKVEVRAMTELIRKVFETLPGIKEKVL